MNHIKRFLVLLWIIFWEVLFVCGVDAATFYVNHDSGDNRNSGRTPQSAWRSPMIITPQDRLVVIGQNKHIQDAYQMDALQISADRKQTLTVFALEQLDQIIIGVRELRDWSAYEHAGTVFQAPLAMNPETQNIEGIYLGEQLLGEACFSDFLNDRSWAWYAGTLYIQSPEGNPDLIQGAVRARLFDSATNSYPEQMVDGWSQSPVSVWQTELSKRPVHLFHNGEIYSESDWWWGEDHCGSAADTLYMRSRSGGPGTEGSTTSAAMEVGGWAATSGDFNGDGLMDTVSSDFGPRIFINYGASDFSPLANSILAVPGDEKVFGFTVAGVGDINGDGFEELLAGMDWGINKAYLFYGSAQGLTAGNYRVIDVPEGLEGYGFGHGLAGGGDLNADGFADFLIAGGGGYVAVYMGSAQGVGLRPNTVLRIAGSQVGEIINLSGIGDINGDGFDDLVVANSQSGSQALSARIYYGSGQGVADPPAKVLTIATPLNDVSKGLTVGPAGDLNGDGYSDLILADPFANGLTTGEGSAYLFYGGAGGVKDTPDLTIANPEPEENVHFGIVAAGIGDFDRDGYDDVAVGCPYGGKVFLFFSSPQGLQPDNYIAIESADEIGWSIAPVGNLTGDAKNYFIVGEEFGVAYLYALKEGQSLSPREGRNSAPIADAGSPQEVIEGATVYLDGSGSSDSDDGIALWQWTQIEGPGVVLSDNFSPTPYFVTPAVDNTGAALKFRLTVSDHHEAKSDSEVLVNVTDNGIEGFPDNVITLSASNGQHLGFKVEQGGSFVAVSVEDPIILIGGTNWDNGFLFDVISLKIKTIDVGGNVLLTCYLSNPVPEGVNVIQYTSTEGWRKIDNQIQFNSDGRQLLITQADGALGDEDGQADGIISLDHFGITTSRVMPPVPGKMTSSDAAGNESSGSGGCFIRAVN